MMTFKLNRMCAVCTVIAVLTAAPSLADTITIGASKDTSIYSDEINNSNGVGISLFSGITSGTNSRRALLAFDVASSVLGGATINSVELTLTSFRNSRSDALADDIFSLHVLTSDWGEAPLPGSDSGPLGGGGIAAADNDATWSSNFHNATAWGTAGGDFAVAASDSQAVGFVDITANPLVPVPTTWSGAGLIADVQQWVDNPTGNFGWVLIGDPANGSRTARIFGSRERSEGTPQLTINFTAVPEPTSIVLVLLASGTLLLCRCNGSLTRIKKDVGT